ncbi:MAG: hypothetical protein RMJ07_04350 [Nitrososphaerota archaeon]|nr:hypothetical protein [Candidatus Bathyarchaeota archaeon]MDW8048894.1 hypothetical protein [Nitrososphaerota archaeon]
MFCLYISYLLTEYALNIISAKETLAYFVIGLGLLIIMNAILQTAPKRRCGNRIA